MDKLYLADNNITISEYDGVVNVLIENSLDYISINMAKEEVSMLISALQKYK